MAAPVISFRSGELKTELDKRGDSSGSVAARDLERYYILLRDALRRVNLSKEEACLICDALNGSMNRFEIDPRDLLRLSIADAIEIDSLDEKWEVDASELLRKLQELTTLQAAAVLDAAEQFWNEPNAELNEKLKEIGLIRG